MIRPYAAGDLEAVLDIWYRASLQAHPFLSDEFLAAERILIADQWLPQSHTIVAATGGAVVGFLSLVDNEIGGLFVDPDYQGQGVGSRLIDEACGLRPFLELNVFAANEGARRFYANRGFRVVMRQINEDSGHPELRLRRDGEQAP